jgi:hypothetical protein
VNAGRLDIHCEIDDGFALCGGNKVPRVPLERFLYLGEAFAAFPRLRQGCGMQRCVTCIELTATEKDSTHG